MKNLKQVVAAVEELAVPDQQLLRAVLSEALYKKAAFHKIGRSENFDTLIAAGLVEKIDDPPGVILSGELGTVRKKLCTYLMRRNENDSYIDEDGIEREIPKGSQFTATVTLGGEVSLSFPDDEITELLDQYGVNRCRRWMS